MYETKSKLGQFWEKMLKIFSVQIQGQPKRIKWMGARDQAVLHTVMLLGGGERKMSDIPCICWFMWTVLMLLCIVERRRSLFNVCWDTTARKLRWQDYYGI